MGIGAAALASGCRIRCTVTFVTEQPPGAPTTRLDETTASRLVMLPLACLTQEFPWKASEVQVREGDGTPPRIRHPSFHGCFDWHSAVHALWSIARVLRLFPALPLADRMAGIMDARLDRRAIAAEIEVLAKEENRGFECPYGWAWALTLAAELTGLPGQRSRMWREAIHPLAQMLAVSIGDYFDRLSFPIRSGVHSNSAFSMALVIDAARILGYGELAERIAARSRFFFVSDARYPLSYEPSGTDFLSPCLAEADLMSRVLSTIEYRRWLAGFLDADLPEPPSLDDPADPITGHLIGLCFHRAWTLRGILRHIGTVYPAVSRFERVAQAHEERGTSLIFESGYQGTHWLATFALYCLTCSSTISR